MKSPLPIIIVLLAMACAARAGEPAGDVLERLLAGEVVAFDSRSDSTGGAAHMQMLAAAPSRALWRVIISCDLAYAFVAGLEHCEVLEDTADRALVRQVVAQPWPVPDQDVTYESLRQPHHEITFRLVDGNLDEMEGYWRFSERAEGTLVDYRIRIRPGIPVPRFIVRRSMEKAMPDQLACIRGLADGSGGADRRRADLARCPGEPPE
jgi:ribosome-associated toxin RatA of RatAB toxin-antitoxin module